MEHTIRHYKSDDKKVLVKKYGRSKAIKFFCIECVGWDGNPKECTDVECALFPYRPNINNIGQNYKGKTIQSR